MTRNTTPQTWAVTVAEFIKHHFPNLNSHVGQSQWYRADQIGYGTLAALGYAEDKEGKAQPHAEARLPDVLPRWDDVCVAVLRLAQEKRLISYQAPDALKTPSRASRRDLPPEALQLSSTILSAYGLGPALAAPELIPVLQTLNLINGSRWTADAELVYWREQPKEWGLNIPTDPRFAVAAEMATSTIPSEIHAEINRLATIEEAEVTRFLTRRKTDQQQR